MSNWKQIYKQGTVWNYTLQLRALARFIGQLTNQPELYRAVPRVKVPRPRTVILTPEQIAGMLSNAQPWMRVFITLALTLGLRHAECLDVRPKNFSPTNHTLTFKAKGGETQSMPTTDQVEALFANAPPGDPSTPLVELYRRKRTTKSSVWYAWNTLKKQAGITADIIPHDLRRTNAVTGYELTKDLRFVWQVLRHKNLSTTTRYLEHIDTANLRTTLQQLWTPKGGVQ